MNWGKSAVNEQCIHSQVKWLPKVISGDQSCEEAIHSYGCKSHAKGWKEKKNNKPKFTCESKMKWTNSLPNKYWSYTYMICMSVLISIKYNWK